MARFPLQQGIRLLKSTYYVNKTGLGEWKKKRLTNGEMLV